MAASTSKQGAGILGAGAAACAACCAPPIIGFLAAASISTLIGVALFGLVGLAVLVIAAAAYLRRRRANDPCVAEPEADPVTVTLGRNPDA